MNVKQFDQFYQQDLLPHLEQMEAKRQEIVRKVTRAGIIAAVIAVALGLFIGSVAEEPLVGLIALPIVGILFWVVIVSRYTKGYTAQFKEDVVGRVVKFVDAGLSYNWSRGISEQAYMASQLFQTTPDRYSCEDLVWGTVGKTAIQFSEVHSEYKTTTTDSKGRTQTRWHTIFKGLFFIADFNKHFQGETVVVQDTAERLLGRFGKKLQAINPSRGQLVELEDVEFEKLFAVYSSDQIEARYLLTPALMARITDFVKRTGHHIALSFVGSNLYVAIPHSKDMFEPRLFKPVNDPKLVQEYLDDLLLAVGIVEDLNPNTRIWTKQ